MLVALVLVAIAGPAMCFPWGLPLPVKDTPEVAAAKSAHLAALSKAQDRSWNGAGTEDDGSWKDDETWRHDDDGSWKDDTRNGGQTWNAQDRSWNAQDRSWNAPVQSWNAQDRSDNGVEEDGSWKDDESWKQYDDGSYKGDDGSWNQDASGRYHDTHEKKWTGPVALPPGYDKHGAPLPVQDTPEVAAEKSKHFHLHARAAAQG